MRLLKKLLLLLSCVTRVRSDACDVGASRALAETTLVDSCDSEACVCAALMLGKLDVAKAAIVSRLSRGEQALRVRAFAVARHDAAEIVGSGDPLEIKAKGVEDTENGQVAHFLMFSMKEVPGSGRRDIPSVDGAYSCAECP